MKGYIYLITSPILNGIKIGKSIRCKENLRSDYVRSYGSDLVIIDYIVCQNVDLAEKLIFNRLNKYKITNEIFQLNKLDKYVTICKQICNSIQDIPFMTISIHESKKDITIWKKQRTLRQHRVLEISNYYIDLISKGKSIQLYPLITCRCDDTLYLIDGQHRLNALYELQKTHELLVRKLQIPVYIIDVVNETEIKQYFDHYNKLKPIEEWEENDDILLKQQLYNNAVNIVDELIKLYPKCIVNGSKVLKYKIKYDELIDFIIRKELSLDNLKDFNTYLNTKNMDYFPTGKSKGSFKKTFDTCKNNKFMIPLIKTSIDAYYDKMLNNI